jgi:hypothetical protein
MRTVQVRMKSSPDLTNNSGTTCWPKRRKKFQHIFWSVIKVCDHLSTGDLCLVCLVFWFKFVIIPWQVDDVSRAKIIVPTALLANMMVQSQIDVRNHLRRIQRSDFDWMQLNDLFVFSQQMFRVLGSLNRAEMQQFHFTTDIHFITRKLRSDG